MYKDLDGDGKLSVLGDGKEGSGDVKYLGDKNPRYNFGFNLSMAWKGFDLSAFIQGVGRRTMFLEGERPVPDARGMVSIRRVLVWKNLDPGKNGRPVSGDHVEG